MYAQACGSTIGATDAPLTGSARLYDLIVLLLSSAAQFWNAATFAARKGCPERAPLPEKKRRRALRPPALF